MFKLVFEKEDGSFKRYENEYGYKVSQKYLSENKDLYNLSVTKDNDLPMIYINMNDDEDNKVESVTMRILSQGELTTKEVDKVIDDCKKAQETIKQIEELIKTL